MDTIIARQSVARRRRPYTPISGRKDKYSSPGPRPDGRLDGLWFEGPLPSSKGKAARGPGMRLPRWEGQRPSRRHRKGGSGGLRGLVAAVLAAFAKVLASAAALRLRLAKGRKAAATASLGGMALLLAPPAAARPSSAPSPAGAEADRARPAPRNRAPAARGRPDARFLRKLLAGLGLLVLALLLAVLGFRLLKPAFPVPAEGLLPPADSLPASDLGGESLLLDFISPDLASPADQADIAALPLPRAVELSTYTVQKGDSIGSIAKRFGRSVDSLLSLNGIKNVKGLKAGTELKIPNMDGVVHVVAKGESLGLIAKSFKVDLTLIADANDLGSTSIRVGQSLFIPGARLAPEELRRIYGTTFAWPLRGPISSRFGVRADPFTGVRRFHAGLDIVVDLGTPVRAAAAGRVADLGYNANYGNYIILSHGDGLQTLYGHLSAFSVTIGQTVAQGAVIGKSGNTGYSTGPHLHFGIYRAGSAVDPFKMLK